MNIEDPEEGAVAVEQLAQAREIFFRSKATMLLALEELEKSESPTRSVKDAVSVGQEFLKALNNMTKHEVEVGKQHSAIRGVLQGGALDLEAARSEVLGRIARHRERGGSGSVSGGSE